jgi:hypothetical protein
MTDQGLEFFLIRTLPSKKPKQGSGRSVPTLHFGNQNPARAIRMIENFKLGPDEGPTIFTGIFETGHVSCHPIRDSGIQAIIRRSRRNWWVASHLCSRINVLNHCGVELDEITGDKKEILSTNFPKTLFYNGEMYINDFLVTEKFVMYAVCYPAFVLVYDPKRLSKGAICSISGSFDTAHIYKDEVWMIEQVNYIAYSLVQLNNSTICKLIRETLDPEVNVLIEPIPQEKIFKKKILFQKAKPQKAESILVDKFRCYVAFPQSMDCYHKKTGILEKSLKFPNSTLDSVFGRGTNIIFLATVFTISAYRASSLEMIATKDLPVYENFNDRKKWQAQVINKVELVFAVGQSSGTITVLCLLGYKFHMICRYTKLVTQAILRKEEYAGYPKFYIDTPTKRIYCYGIRKPIAFKYGY